MIENLLYTKCLPISKRPKIKHTLKMEPTIKHLEQEMELNDLESDEPLVKTQMAVTKKNKKVKTNNKQTEKVKTQTPKTVPNKTLKNDQCRYCKETGHMMADCPKLAKRRKFKEVPVAKKGQNCSTPGHDEKTCYFGANMENRPPKWTLTEAQKKVLENYQHEKKTIKPTMERQHQSSSKDSN